MSQDRRFFGRAWRSLSSTRNVFGKLCLVALLQFVPVVGQMVALAYFLRWSREASWGMETPLGAHVLGGGERGFWSRGALAWVTEVLYGLIAVAVDVLILCVLLYGEHGLDRLGASVFVGVGSAVLVVTNVLLLICCNVGLVRLAIYGRFSAAWQWGKSLKMAFHDFGGLLKVAFGWLWLQVVLAVAVALVYAASVTLLSHAFVAVPLVNLLLAGMDGGAYDYGYLTHLYLAFVQVSPFLCVTGFFLGVPYLIVSAVSWRALGNWAAGFDVARWGSPTSPLPFERTPSSGPATPAPTATAPVSEGTAGMASASASGDTQASDGTGDAATATPSSQTVTHSGTVASSKAGDGAQAEASAEPRPVPDAAAPASVVPASVPEAPRPPKRSHPVLVIVLCFLISFAVIVCSSVLSSGLSRGTWFGGGRSTPAAATDVVGVWSMGDGSTLALGADRTFRLDYFDGRTVWGTYRVSDALTRADLSDLGVHDDTAVWGELASAMSAYQVSLSATRAVDASGADLSSQARGSSLDLVFVTASAWDGVVAEVYDVSGGSAAGEVKAWRM